MPTKYGKPPSSFKLLSASMLKPLWTKHKNGEYISDIDAFYPLSFGLFTSYTISFVYKAKTGKPCLSVFYGISGEAENFKDLSALLASDWIGGHIKNKKLYIRPND